MVERAKGILMQQKGVPEDEAFRLMRKLAMDRNAKLLEVAQQVVDVASAWVRTQVPPPVALAHSCNPQYRARLWCSAT